MNTYVPLHILTKEEASRYSELVERKSSAYIINVLLSTPTYFDIVVDDERISIYYQGSAPFIRDYLALNIPGRGGRLFLNGLQKYLQNEYNWIHFRNFTWVEWKSFFRSVGFLG